MEGNWNVYLEERAIGSCHVERRGLYCQITCRCSKMGEGICRLWLQCGEEGMDLGILVPMKGGFGLDKRIAFRNLPTGEPKFVIVPGNAGNAATFIPVRGDVPFPRLDQLGKARFAMRNGEPGILLDAENP